MASFFKQLSDDMEMVARVVEEGTKFMMGESVQMGEHRAESTTNLDNDVHFDDIDAVYDEMDVAGDAYDSPLMGMADSVMYDIMSSQVCLLRRLDCQNYSIVYLHPSSSRSHRS